jgi:hypothetical protein
MAQIKKDKFDDSKLEEVDYVRRAQSYMNQKHPDSDMIDEFIGKTNEEMVEAASTFCRAL